MMDLTNPFVVIILVLGLILIIIFVIYCALFDKYHPEICPSCGRKLNYKSAIRIYDADCPICHGTGQGNGAYTGDSGECTCGFQVETCPFCGSHL